MSHVPTIADRISETFGELQVARQDVDYLIGKLDSTEGALVPLERVQASLRAAQRDLLTARTWWIAEHPVQDPDQLVLEVTR